MFCLFLFFFFFQADDGIRDTSVTAVQTCALPIWDRLDHSLSTHRLELVPPPAAVRCSWPALARRHARFPPRRGSRKIVGDIRCDLPVDASVRSEERRVGKECRCGWQFSHSKNMNE